MPIVLTMRIRDVEWKDFPDLVDNYFRLYEEVRTDPGLGILLFAKKPSLADEVQWFSTLYRNLLNQSHVASVAEVDGHAVGLVVVGRGPHEEGAHVGDLGINIRDGYRDRGVGKALMKDVLQKCRGKFEMVQ